MNLPVFEMVINPDESSEVEVAAVAFVDAPAIEKNFFAFRDQRLSFAVNPEQRIVSGPAMIADQLIYRKDNTGEYNVFFSKNTIKEIALKFFKKDYQKNLNLFHDPSLSLEGVTIFESFVSDEQRGIQPMKGFEDLPDGTWFISAKIENDEVWNKIKSGEVKGFSVEGIFSFMKKQNGTGEGNNPFNSEKDFMSKLKDMYEKFFGSPVVPAPAMTTEPEKLSTDVTLKDGTVVTVDKLEVGGVAMVGDAPAPVGEHELADGTKIVVGEGGVIEAVQPAVMPEEEMQKPVDYSEQFKAYDDKLAAYEQKFTEHLTAFNSIAEKFAAQEQKIQNLIELVGKIVEEPTAESVQGNKGQFNTQVKKTDKYELINRIKNLNKK